MISSKRTVKHFLNKCCVTHSLKPSVISRPNRSAMCLKLVLQKECFDFAIYNKFFFQASQILQSGLTCRKYLILFYAIQNIFSRSKLLNKTHISLNENVFSLIKRDKHLAEFSDFPLLEVLAIYLYLKAYPKYRAQR